MRIIPDKDCPVDKVYFINTDSLVIHYPAIRDLPRIVQWILRLQKVKTSWDNRLYKTWCGKSYYEVLK